MTSSGQPERPARMYRNGRPEDQNFNDPLELLYRRCVRDDVSQGRLINARIGYKNLSVNWSRYSEPEDVIFNTPDLGIAQWKVEHIPASVKPESPEDGKEFCFRPAHVPEEENYSHCEVWAYRDGKRVEKPNPSDAVKKLYRAIMAQHSVVIREPKV